VKETRVPAFDDYTDRRPGEPVSRDHLLAVLTTTLDEERHVAAGAVTELRELPDQPEGRLYVRVVPDVDDQPADVFVVDVRPAQSDERAALRRLHPGEKY
jgi:hypothetical protein